MPTVLASWTAHPARRRPRDVALVIAVWAVTMAAVIGSLRSWYLAILATVILALAIAPFLFPTRYTVTDLGVEARRGFSRRSRRFADLRRVEVGGDLALLSPFARRHLLDSARGLLVLLDGLGAAERERVLALLRERVAKKEPA